MSEYDNTNTGTLFKNDKGDNQKRPDYKGSVNVEGREYWLSAWIKEKRDGSGKFMSLKVEAKEQRQDAHNQAKSNGYQPQPQSDDNDEIPF